MLGSLGNGPAAVGGCVCRNVERQLVGSHGKRHRITFRESNQCFRITVTRLLDMCVKRGVVGKTRDLPSPPNQITQRRRRQHKSWPTFMPLSKPWWRTLILAMSRRSIKDLRHARTQMLSRLRHKSCPADRSETQNMALGASDAGMISAYSLLPFSMLNHPVVDASRSAPLGNMSTFLRSGHCQAGAKKVQ